MSRKKVTKQNAPRASETYQADTAQESAPNDNLVFLGLKEKGLSSHLTWYNGRTLLCVFFVGAMITSLYMAYTVRLRSIELYGSIIHEFDPWFNFRATEYLEKHGWYAFFHWFDRMSWYPLGRAVGSTIFPGMQITAVAIYRVLQAVGIDISLNDVCVLIPAWFGVLATAILGAIAYEISASLAVAAVATFTFSILPAHTMRSMAGEFDNECISIAAMLLTFYFWIRSLRTPQSWPIGLLAGLSYGYMAAAWGGYIFVTNMIALHACVCVVVDWMWDQYNNYLLKSYTLFFVVGTAIAVSVPIIGMSPFKSLEQLSALLVFCGLYALHVSEYFRRRAGYRVRSMETLRLRIRVVFALFVTLLAVALTISPRNYFGPFSARVRALFVAHTRTGNPLVDSVAEHNPTSAKTYKRYLSICRSGWAWGFIYMSVLSLRRPTPARSFWLLYSCTSYYFSKRMSRLLLLAGPAASLMTACCIGGLMDYTVDTALSLLDTVSTNNTEAGTTSKIDDMSTIDCDDRQRHTAHTNKTSSCAPRNTSQQAPSLSEESYIIRILNQWFSKRTLYTARCVAAVAVGAILINVCYQSDVKSVSYELAVHIASPRLKFYAQIQRGQPPVLIDDYYASYLWLRNNTPADARILAWWDYGYQITGIGNRTTLADGNTRDHEHIGTIGKLLTSPVNESHALIRHLADYVYIWGGVRSDDLMKSAHMARIGNSVHRDICPNDPLCKHFGFIDNSVSRPTETMRKSLIYNLHGAGINPGAYVSPKKFRKVYESKYGLVRIYKVMNVSQESKAWVENPENHLCEPPPHSWICRGQYPPAPEIQDIISKRWSFSRDKNPQDDEWLKQYHKEYMQQWH